MMGRREEKGKTVRLQSLPFLPSSRQQLDLSKIIIPGTAVPHHITHELSLALLSLALMPFKLLHGFLEQVELLFQGVFNFAVVHNNASRHSG